MGKIIASILIALFCNACSTSSSGSPYIKELLPLSKIPGLGTYFIIPDEDGWMLFDPDGKGSMIVKHGNTVNESYVISLVQYQQPQPKSVNSFKALYNTLKNSELSNPRYKTISTYEIPVANSSDYFLKFHYLVEDHGASNMPKNTEYMLLETMGFFAINPEVPNNLVMVAYSHRYLPKHKDSKFKEKANWVLKNVKFITQ